jgi:hypothetical protein
MFSARLWCGKFNKYGAFERPLLAVIRYPDYLLSNTARASGIAPMPQISVHSFEKS